MTVDPTKLWALTKLKSVRSLCECFSVREFHRCRNGGRFDVGKMAALSGASMGDE